MSETAVVEYKKRSLIEEMAVRYGLEPGKFLDTIKATVFPAKDGEKNPMVVSNEQAAAFLVVANQYELNPFTREIYAFPSKTGGITPIVSIDGWLSLVNRNPMFNGMKFEDKLSEDGKNLVSVKCLIFRKDRLNPIEVTEYMAECKRGTDPWNQWPRRMLRHKAMIQCARYAFGFAGVYDPDEGERIHETIEISHTIQPTEVRRASEIANGTAEPAPAVEPAKANGNFISEKQLKRFLAITHENGWGEAQVKDILREKWGVESRLQITKEQYEDVCAFFESQGATERE